MYFPTANDQSYVHIEDYQGKNCIKLSADDRINLDELDILNYDNSGLYTTYYTSGYVRLLHKNLQTYNYWEKLKSWIEFKLNQAKD